MLSAKGIRDRKAARGKLPAVKRALRTLVSGDTQVQARYGCVCVTFDSILAVDEFVRKATAVDQIVARLRADAQDAIEHGSGANAESSYAFALLRACGIHPTAPATPEPGSEDR
jgi:hypothetical protein